MSGLPLLEITSTAPGFARHVLTAVGLPRQAAVDAEPPVFCTPDDLMGET